MNDHTEKDSSRQNKIRNYLEMIRSMSESTDDYIFLYDYDTGRFHFTNHIEIKYNLPSSAKDGIQLADWLKTVYARDIGPVTKDLQEILRADKDIHNMEYRLTDRNGNRCWISFRGKVLYDSDETPLIMLGRVSDTVLGQKTDPLTGLLNTRKYVEDITASVNAGKKGCLLVFGLDNFKEINIKYGRTFGNYILKCMAEALEENVDPSFLLYRLDGDRFAVNLIDQNEQAAKQIYSNIQTQLLSWCTLSAGMVLYGDEIVQNGDILYQYAENALDRAKKQGKNTLAFFSLNDYAEQRSVVELTAELRHSIHHDFQGFSLHYQPQIFTDSCSIYGAEALLRYTSPTRGEVPPAEFIPLLEQSELICRIGPWILKTAILTCKKWRSVIPDLHISVNISYLQLKEEGITELVLAILRESGLPGDALTLEITESMQLDDYLHYNKIFYQWEKEGIQIAIDDFGTGYSSLSYLKSIEINEIKIDRCFVRGIQNSDYNYRLLQNTIELAKSTQIHVCCEGVETEDELAILRELKPETLQGFLFSVPLTQEQFENAYLHSDSDSYRSRQKQELRYRSITASQSTENAEAADNQELISIIESMDELVCVSDPKTYELYYMNSSGRRISGIYDYKGRKCYEIMYGRSTPCEACTNHLLSKNEFHIREVENTYLNARFLMKEKLIPWNKQMARLEITVNLNTLLPADRMQDALPQTVLSKEKAEDPVSELSAFELQSSHTNDILAAAQLGLWIIRVHREPEQNEMFADKVMLSLLGLDHAVSPSECYRQWYSRINDGYYRYVQASIERMMSTRHIVQLEYTWNHPIQGEVVVRCLGVRVNDSNGMACIYGYHRIISNIDRPNFLPERTTRAVFEYNGNRKTIYFHSGSELLGIPENKAEHFPECWIESGIVHPDFAELFSSVFTDVQSTPDIPEIEVLLRNSLGIYEWFKLRAKHISQSKQDMCTLIVILDYVNQELSLELQSMRKSAFYQAMLSETVAYAEVDMKTGYPLTTGGLWRSYEQECHTQRKSFFQIINRHLPENVAEEDFVRCSGYFTEEAIRSLSENQTQKYCFQRISNGKPHWVEMVIHVFQEEFTKNTYSLLYLKDIDTEKKKELAQASAANTDPLTQIYNRRMFEQEVKHFLHRDNGTHTGALLLLDLDNFKAINDQYGHSGGDEALLRMTEVLQSTFRHRDLVGRLGGDEFVAFLKDMTRRDILDRRIQQLQDALLHLKGAPLTCSVGITFMHGEKLPYSDYLKQADLALYRSKQLGKNRAFYFEDM